VSLLLAEGARLSEVAHLHQVLLPDDEVRWLVVQVQDVVAVQEKQSLGCLFE
jgi:hypothetical protein